jgi:hypothetical protein
MTNSVPYWKNTVLTHLWTRIRNRLVGGIKKSALPRCKYSRWASSSLKFAARIDLSRTSAISSSISLGLSSDGEGSEDTTEPSCMAARAVR